VDKVYVLWFVQEQNEHPDIELLVGVFSSQTEAQRVIELLKNKSGFADFPDGFRIEAYELNKFSWTEGFVRTE
jgi:homoserine kinase type II